MNCLYENVTPIKRGVSKRGLFFFLVFSLLRRDIGESASMGISRDKLFIFGYFLGIILMGSFLLELPLSWQGGKVLPYIDSLFTSTSAVCVTGLTTVDTSLYSRFGQTVIALLIQFGGLGLITFATVYAAMPKKRISLISRGIIKDYYIDEVDYDPKRIVKHIVITTAAIESIGTLILYLHFRTLKDGLFVSVFHAISAFCNAGFSTFSNNLESYVADPVVCLTISGLIVLGGIGFMVMSDVGKCVRGKKKRLSSHSRVVIGMTFTLIVVGAILFLALEWNHGAGKPRNCARSAPWRQPRNSDVRPRSIQDR